MIFKQLLHLILIAMGLLLFGCDKPNSKLGVENRARLIAEEIKQDQVECRQFKSKFIAETHSESDLHNNFLEAQKLHCLHGDI